MPFIELERNIVATPLRLTHIEIVGQSSVTLSIFAGFVEDAGVVFLFNSGLFLEETVALPHHEDSSRRFFLQPGNRSEHSFFCIGLSV